MTSLPGRACVQPEGIMKSTLHRAGVAIATTAVTATLALAPTAAHAAAPSPQATSAAQWLADQVPEDSHLFTSVYGAGEGESFIDIGLNLDIQHALAELGDSATADQVYDAAVAGSADYTDFFGTRYAGSVAKLAAYVQLHGDDATNIDGRNLIEDLEGLQVTTGEEAGRLKDSPDGDYQSANTIGQSWGVRALVAVDSDAAEPAEAFLVDQQCDDGGFRLYQSGAGCSSNVDATTFAIAALQDAGGHVAELADAGDFLTSGQARNGSFSESGSANSNSTGLAAVALSSLGEPAAATRAADWLATSQQTTASTPGLADEVGAVAFDADGLVAGKADGIDTIERDQWVRATAQAAPGLQFATAPVPDPEPGPVASITLKLSTSAPTEGDTITITATGKDADGVSTGDVSDELEVKSSVETDTIDGNTVTFNHASPHTITATHVPTGTTASVLVEVSPLAAETPTTGTDSASGGVATVSNANGTLPDTGSLVEPWQLAAAAALLVLGAAMVVGGRRRVTVRSTHRVR